MWKTQGISKIGKSKKLQEFYKNGLEKLLLENKLAIWLLKFKLTNYLPLCTDQSQMNNMLIFLNRYTHPIEKLNLLRVGLL